MCQRLPFTVSNRATTGTTRLPHAVPSISSTVPMFSQSQHIHGAFQKVQLAVRVIQPFHLHMTQKVMSACARLCSRNWYQECERVVPKPTATCRGAAGFITRRLSLPTALGTASRSQRALWAPASAGQGAQEIQGLGGLPWL